ncbi:MAG: hypothetical protein LBF87_04455 [Treponema sp.]|jgi:hypothetical protein|nr:hypothetical protein [Treponema sp.]
MNKIIISLLVALLAAAEAVALPAQKLLYPGDWAYDALAVLAQEQGLVFFADSTLTVSQLNNMLDEIDDETLSPSGQRLRRQLREYLAAPPLYAYQSDAIEAGVDVEVTTEAFVKSNSAVPWIHDNYERRPLFVAPLTLSFGSWLTAGLDPQFAENEKTTLRNDNYTNIPIDLAPEFDLHFPKRAYLSIGIPFGKASGVYFSIGIGENFYGRTRTGSILLSDYMDRVSFGRLSLFSPNLRYGAEIMQLEATKYLYMHYLQLRLFKRLTLSFTEGMMVNAPLELRYLNPLMVFHNLEPWKTYDDYNEDLGNGDTPAEPTGETRAGAFFGTKIEYQLGKYIRLYGLLGLSQLQLPIEREHWEDDLTPDALAFQLGTEASLPAWDGYWRFGLEGVYTYPYMYLKWDKGWSYYKESTQVDNMTLRQWTGTPFGPDSIAGTLWAGYEVPRSWSLTLSFLFAAQGELSSTDIFNTEKYRSSPEVADVVKPLTGTPTYTSTISLKGTWSPYSWIHLMLQPGYRIINNYDHESGKTEHGFELALSVQVLPGK